jgi:uncharacterized repeat protein (TIGR03806 family)
MPATLSLTCTRGIAASGVLVLSGCGGVEDAQVLNEPWRVSPGARQPAYLEFPASDADDDPALLAPSAFPQRLSETGAFADTLTLAAVGGIVPYEIQAPLWSDGAIKSRWLSVPAGTSLSYDESGQLRFPPGTVLVKHFEMALDERVPEQRQRLETRFWIVASDSEQYGVTYKWNDGQSDAELLQASETEQLSIVGVDGQTRTQPYFYPGSGDCNACHHERAGFVLGLRAAQLNRPTRYDLDRPANEQLLDWSNWGILETPLDVTSVARVPRLAAMADESASLQDRVRSYWDGNCSMCHAGAAGRVPGWDARFSTPFEEQGLFEAPRNALTGAARLITPGSPEESLIYLRGNTTEPGLRMPPLARHRIDTAYVELLARWITSLEPLP